MALLLLSVLLLIDCACGELLVNLGSNSLDSHSSFRCFKDIRKEKCFLFAKGQCNANGKCVKHQRNCLVRFNQDTNTCCLKQFCQERKMPLTMSNQMNYFPLADRVEDHFDIEDEAFEFKGNDIEDTKIVSNVFEMSDLSPERVEGSGGTSLYEINDNEKSDKIEQNLDKETSSTLPNLTSKSTTIASMTSVTEDLSDSLEESEEEEEFETVTPILVTSAASDLESTKTIIETFNKTVAVTDQAYCNKTVCPSLPLTCKGKEGSCLVKAICDQMDKTNCSCNIEVKCFESQKHVYFIEYELEERTTFPPITPRSNAPNTIPPMKKGMTPFFRLFGMKPPVTPKIKPRKDSFKERYLPKRNVTLQPKSMELTEYGLSEEMSASSTTPKSNVKAKSPEALNFSVKSPEAIHNSPETVEASVSSYTPEAKEMRESIEKSAKFKPKVHGKVTKSSLESTKDYRITSEEMSSTKEDNYGYFEDTATTKAGMGYTKQTENVNLNSGLYKQKCYESSVEEEQFDFKTINKDIELSRRSKFSIKNVTGCSESICDKIKSPCKAEGQCRTFGICTGTKCRCFVKTKCYDDLGYESKEKLEDISPKKLTKLLKNKKTLEFPVEKAKTCSDDRCKSLGKVCQIHGVCRTVHKCFGQCKCAINLQCFDKSGKPMLNHIEDDPYIEKAQKLLANGGNVTIFMNELFQCSTENLCPKYFSNVCNGNAVCTAHPTCDQALPMCVVSVMCQKEVLKATKRMNMAGKL